MLTIWYAFLCERKSGLETVHGCIIHVTSSFMQDCQPTCWTGIQKVWRQEIQVGDCYNPQAGSVESLTSDKKIRKWAWHDLKTDWTVVGGWGRDTEGKTHINTDSPAWATRKIVLFWKEIVKFGNVIRYGYLQVLEICRKLHLLSLPTYTVPGSCLMLNRYHSFYLPAKWNLSLPYHSPVTLSGLLNVYICIANLR